jgi:hypothetical protein
MRMRHAITTTLSVALTIGASQLSAQPTLTPIKESGQTVTPAFEGWYRNPDGTFSLSFGFLNRNSKEVVEIPVGPNNFVAPGDSNQGQPTHFAPRRHWGVFAIKVPANFGDKKVTWTVSIRGHTYAIPGSLKRGWEIDALQGEAGSGNTPPVLKFSANGPTGSGPGGVTARLTATVGKPLTVVVWASDDGKARSSVAGARGDGAPVSLMWFVHQGPADVDFSTDAPRVDAEGKATTSATFHAPGEYVLRVRANDASGVAGAGHAQCCWTNGFVQVTVTR